MRFATFAAFTAFVIPLLSFALTSCATMSAKEKGQYLEQYRQIAEQRQQRAFEDPHGVKDQYRARIKADGNDARGKKVIENIVFTENTGHGLDTLKKLFVDADVRAMDEAYTGEQVRYWVDFYRSDRGKKMLTKEFQLRRQMDAEIAANPSKASSAAQRFSARYTAATERIAHHFEAGVGRAIIDKQGQYNTKRRRYEQEAQKLYNQKVSAAIAAYNQQGRGSGHDKTKAKTKTKAKAKKPR